MPVDIYSDEISVVLPLEISLDVDDYDEMSFELEVDDADISIDLDMDMDIVTGGAAIYTGAYEVTPNMSEQILETKNKIMADDVTVHQVPVYRTTNVSGGVTVYIATEGVEIE